MISLKSSKELYLMVVVPYGRGFLEELGSFTTVEMKLESPSEVTVFQYSRHLASSSWTWIVILALILLSSIRLVRRYNMKVDTTLGSEFTNSTRQSFSRLLTSHQ